MTIYTDRIVLVFPIESKKRPAAAALQTLEITESGREIEEVIPLDPDQVKDYADAFNLPLVSELASVKTDNESLRSALKELNEKYDALQSENIKLTSDVVSGAERVTATNEVIRSLTEELKAAIAAREELHCKVCEMQAHPDVIEAERAKAIIEAREQIASAAAVLAEFGEPIEVMK